jgi:hypothetical protein
MAKQVLGRNLEALQDAGAGKIQASAPEIEPVGSGVRSLMRGHQPNPASQPKVAPARKPVIPLWYIFGADILLAALALAIAFKSPHPLTWQRELFCAAAVALGGCLALGAVWLADIGEPSGARARIVAHGKTPEKFRDHKTNHTQAEKQEHFKR